MSWAAKMRSAFQVTPRKLICHKTIRWLERLFEHSGLNLWCRYWKNSFFLRVFSDLGIGVFTFFPIDSLSLHLLPLLEVAVNYGSQRPASFAKGFASSISNFGMLNSMIGVTLHWLVVFCDVTKASSLEEPKSVI